MRTRRTLALSLVLCLLLSLVALPRGPLLVCRITGVPMAPVVTQKAVTAKGSCCDIAVTVRPDGAVRAELTAPGCCELRPGAGHTVAPAVPNAVWELPVAVLVNAPSAAPMPSVIAIALPGPGARESAPRAPPRRYSSPRAPPCFS